MSTVIPASNALKLKVGGRVGGIDPQALARAEAALKSLEGQFGGWLEEELVKLDQARAAVRRDGLTTATADRLYTVIHDLKGLGATYGFPLVTQLAGSAARLLEEPSTRLAAPMFLVEAHLDAIRAAVKGDIRDDDHPVGRGLLEELRSQVARIAGPAERDGAEV